MENRNVREGQKTTDREYRRSAAYSAALLAPASACATSVVALSNETRPDNRNQEFASLIWNKLLRPD